VSVARNQQNCGHVLSAVLGFMSDDFPMAKTDVTIVSAQIPTATRVELERRAQDGYRSISSEIRLALDEHLRHEQKKDEK
jgi:hypothetical protein